MSNSGTSLALRLENIAKLYRLGTVGTGTFAHDLRRWWHRLRGKEDPYAKLGQVNDRTKASSSGSSEYVWALRDVSFDVPQGQILGIIGRNGAGKSTLLKLLSRVTSPTRGCIKSRGRIASLLEVGTGFHPELTGRENLFLNGAVLGMKRREIESRLDEIVEFSGCAKYLDTPVKRYSSGMLVRLGFAVAAHLDCDIMIVDEVLAVGDADFQKKCIVKMRGMHRDGRTVLMVSHQLNLITSLCDRGIVLDVGGVTYDGSPGEAVLHYQAATGSSTECDFVPDTAEFSDHRARLIRAWTEDSSGQRRRTFDLREPFRVRMEYEILVDDLPEPYANFHFFDPLGNYAFYTASTDATNTSGRVTRGRYLATCEVSANLLNTGQLTIGVALTGTDSGTKVCFYARDALMVHIQENLVETLDTTRCGYAGPIPGVVRPQLPWRFEKLS